MVRVFTTAKEIRDYVDAAKREKLTIGFVPTMGAFHEGHLSLMRKAREESDRVIVSIFVNPLQFSAGEDYDCYPRQESKDIKMAETEKVDAIFTPSVAEMYPKGFLTSVDMDDLPNKLCGSFRKGHFRGVMTVLCKLFNMVRPDIVYCGQKDYQQAVIIRRMVTDLNFDAHVRVMPTVREEDGLAMSSRNAYLGPKQRKDAVVIYNALKRAEEMISLSENSSAEVIKEMKAMIGKVKGARVEYIAIVNQDTLESVKEIKGKTLCAVAVRIGKARLIDNILIN